MKYIIFPLFFLMQNALFAQKEAALEQKIKQSIVLNQYLFLPLHNGGSELSYNLSYNVTQNIEVSARTGVLFLAPSFSNNRTSDPIFSKSTSYIPLYLGVGIYLGERKQNNFQIEFGVPFFWLSDYSKGINQGILDSYWMNKNNTVDQSVSGFRDKILLIPQIQYVYCLKSGLGFQFGISSYFTKVLTPEINGVNFSYSRNLNFKPSLKLGLSYRF